MIAGRTPHERGGYYFEDFAVGASFRHKLRRTVTQMDNILFSNMTLNPQPLHIDADFCARHAEATPGSHARLVVRDTGRGMDAEVRARAVEPFFSTKPRGQGAGLGLSMARGFADHSGGALKIDSEPGSSGASR